MTNADPTAQVRSLLEAGRIMEAAETLCGYARASDRHALYELSLWAISGNIVQRDLQLARMLLEQAKNAGHEDAALLYAYFVASGTGGKSLWGTACDLLRQIAEKSDFARTQILLIDKMALDPNGNPLTPFEVRFANAQPKIAVSQKFLTSDECDHIIAQGAPHLSPSHVVDPKTGQMIPHPVRRSHGAMFGVYTEDLVINAVNRRIAALSGTAYDQGEPLQLLHYQKGDEYRPHIDALPGEQNQRVITVIMYLTDDYQGGETQFLRADFSFKGQKGDALMFANVLPNGQAGQLSLHCGKPVTGGTKIIATRWIRQARFTYPPPKPILENFPAFID